MVPDSDASRLARLEQRVDDLAHDVRAFAPMVIEHATLKANLDHLASAVKAVREELHELVEHMDQRDAADRQDRRSMRNVGFTIIGAIVVQLIATATAVAVALATGSPGQ